MALDYAKVTGRFAIMLGDTPDDPDEDPQLLYLDSGQVIFTPNTKVVHTYDDPPLIITPSPVTAAIDGTGRLSINGVQQVFLLDLGSDTVNPSTARDKGAWTVQFSKLKAGTASVDLPSFSFNPDATKATNDLGAAQPLPAAGGTAIVVGPRGPAGVGVPDTSTAQDGWVVTYDADTATTIWTPPASGLADADIAALVDDPDTQTGAALVSTINDRVRPADGLQAWGHSYAAGAIGTGTGGYPQTFVPTLGELLGLPARNNAWGGSQLYVGDTGVSVLQNVTRPALNRYTPPLGLHTVMWGLNDLNGLGNTTAALAPFKEALRVVVSRMRAGAIYEDDNTTYVSYTGTWSTLDNRDRNSGAGMHYTGTNGDSVTITTPDEFPGGTMAVHFTSWADNGGGVFTSDPINGQTYTIDTRPASAVGVTTLKVLRIPNVPAGSASYTFTASDITGGVGAIFDCWDWEPAPEDGSLVALVKQPKIIDYSPYSVTGGIVPTDAGVDALNGIIDTVAAEFGGRVLTVDLSGMDKDPAYFVTGNVHPTIEGHRHIAEKIAATVKGLIRPTTTRQVAAPRLEYATAAPTGPSREFRVGDQVINAAPAAGGFIGWVCVADGAPGTWKGYGAIEA